MKLSLHLFYGCILLFLFVFLMIGCNAVAFQTKAAWEAYDEAVAQIEDSHFQSDVIENVVKKGHELGYDISVGDDSAYKERPRYKVELTYLIQIPMIRYEKQRKISGYAI